MQIQSCKFVTKTKPEKFNFHSAMEVPVAEKPNSAEENLVPEVIKKELLTPKSTNPKPMEENSTLAQLSKSTNPLSPSTPPVGKRIRKPKEIHDEVSPITKKKKKKQSSSSKFQIVIRDSASTSLCFRKEKDAPTKGLTSTQATSAIMIRAEEIQSSLGNECPSIIKLLVKSHVGSGFWMGLPAPFCRAFLPEKDTTMLLENENGEPFEVKYLAEKTGLSGGWKKFAVGNNLVEGDVLVFHLVESYKFKVYVIRANDISEVNGALSLLTLEAPGKHTDEVSNGENFKDKAETMVIASPKTKKRKQPKSLPLTLVQKKHKRSSLSSRSSLPQGSEEVGSEVLEGPRPIKTTSSFEEIKSFEDFHIVVDGFCIDTELPERVRINYYELCQSKQEFLHDLLPKNIYYKLVAGMIGETVNIANEMRACKPTTKFEEFDGWDKSLKSFELLGMKVGFLRDRLGKLLSLAFESEGALDQKRYMEVKLEQSRTEDEIKKLEEKLLGLRETSRKFDVVIETLKDKVERYQIKFQEEVNTPW